MAAHTQAVAQEVDLLAYTDALEAVKSLGSSVQERAQSVFNKVQATLSEPTEALFNKIAQVLANPLFKKATSFAQIVRVAILTMTLGSVDILALMVLPARLASGIAHIWNANHPQEAQAKAFTQGGGQEEASKLQKLINKAFSPAQQETATGVAIIARGSLEAAFPLLAGIPSAAVSVYELISPK